MKILNFNFVYNKKTKKWKTKKMSELEKYFKEDLENDVLDFDI